jgi:propanol-preferring alcohol dehydrogenase
MTSTMQALQLTGWGKEPELVLVPVPEPGPGELLLRVDAAGLCHSDLHVMDSPGTLPYALPFTLGHEVAGTVVDVGSDVSTEWVDERVAVHGVWSCGECRRCLVGRENYCLRLTGPVGGGLGYDGGLAEFMLVPSERFLVKADGVPAEQLAPLTDAGLTAYHGVHSNLDTLADDGVALVIGVGGLGHLAIQVLRALSKASVVVVDPREAARSLALRHGAATAVPSLDETEAGVDLVLDFVGSHDTLAAWSWSAAPAAASPHPRRPACHAGGRCRRRSGAPGPISRPWSRWPPAAHSLPRSRPAASTARRSSTGGSDAARFTAGPSSSTLVHRRTHAGSGPGVRRA